MLRRGVKILKTTFGIVSNSEELVSDLFFSVAYESLLTDYHKVEVIEFRDDLDCYIFIHEDPDIPFKISISNNNIYLTGSILKATKECSDLRFTLFGNEGLIFRYVIMLLERRYNIYSFHACSLYDKENNHMYIAPGGAGSGKTCLILKGLELGLQLFSTEMTHFSVDGQFALYKGSLIDNVRIGNLKYSYPKVPKMLSLDLPDSNNVWLKKIPIDLSSLQVSNDILYYLKVTVILPHIEEDRKQCFIVDIKDKRVARKALFDNLRDKLSETILLYDTVPMIGLDSPDLMRKRVIAVDAFIEKTERIVKVTAGAQNCWDGILEK